MQRCVQGEANQANKYINQTFWNKTVLDQRLDSSRN